MLEISVREKSGSEKLFNFEKGSIMLGRAAGNDIQLESGGVSRYHARITLDEGLVVVQDLNSTNGTFVNSERIERKQIEPEDGVSIGDYLLKAKPSARTDDESDNGGEKNKQDLKRTTVQDRAALLSQVLGVPEEEEDTEPTEEFSEDFYWQSLRSFLAPVWKHIVDDGVSEVLINGPEQVYIERKGRLERTDEKFSPDQLSAAVLNISQYVGRRVNEDQPYMDARLPDGSRVAVLLPPCSRVGASISIRKFSKEKLTLEKLMQFGSLSPEMVAFIKGCVLLRKNIIVSGGTSSGKTSLLNVISGLIPDDERILTIEDSAELQLSQEHVLPMETKPADKKGRGEVTIRDLVKASLRMRPDRIVVGEIRGGEAIDLLQAMNTGHSGSMTTLHASSPVQALSRLETLALFSGLEIPVRALREQVVSAIDIVIQAARLPDHTRKVTHITQVCGLSDDGSFQTEDIFRFVRTGSKEGKIIGEHKLAGHAPKFLDELDLAGLSDAVKLFSKAH